MWTRLDAKKLDRDLRGTSDEILRELAKAAGLKIEFPAGSEKDPWLAIPHCIRQYRGQTSVLEGLEELLPGSGAPFTAIFETDRIRIVSNTEAALFWLAWSASERFKK